MKRLGIVVLCLVLTACGTLSKGKGSPAPAAATAAEKPSEPAPKANDTPKKAAKPKAAKEAQPPTPEAEGEQAPAVNTKDPAPRVTLDVEDCTLGTAANTLAEKVGGSLVVMRGLESRPVGDLKFQNETFDHVAEHLAKTTGCLCQAYPHHRFIYPAGYEVLLDLSLAGAVDPALAAKPVAASFSGRVPLFKALALLGSSLGVAIVADNVVGSAEIGPVALSEMPLQEVLEALLRSARVAPAAFRLESTPEYVFLCAASNPVPRSTLLRPETVTPEQNAIMEKQVRVVLPVAVDDAAQADVSSAPRPLGSVLGALSRQLGVEVAVADKALAAIPVNPCVLPNVRVRTAMDLLIRQWPDAGFGYAFQDGRLVIQRLTGAPAGAGAAAAGAPATAGAATAAGS